MLDRICVQIGCKLVSFVVNTSYKLFGYHITSDNTESIIFAAWRHEKLWGNPHNYA